MERKGEMQYFREGKAAIVIVALSLILLAFMLLVTTKTITNVSGLVLEGVGVYWDSGCTDEVFSIDWGNLTPGSAGTRDVFVQNEDVVPIYLNMSTKEWSPSEAFDYLTLRWNYTFQRIDLGDVLQLTLTLSVVPYIKDISDFSFDIVICGSDRLPGDVNGDGIVDTGDKILVGLAFWSEPGDPNYDPYADVNVDGSIDTGDKIMILYIYSCIWAGSTS